eukprot:2223132-Pyramimonas_sp.AAC.1
MFEPLKATVTLLKKYNIALDDKTLKQLEEAPMTWSSIKKKMFNVREKLSNEQQEEARKIRETSDVFQAKVFEFRASFKELAPFAVTNFTKDTSLKLDHVEPAYEVLEHFHHGPADEKYKYGSVTEIVEESRRLNESQELFELFVSDYIDLRRCNEELGYLKGLWDQVNKGSTPAAQPSFKRSAAGEFKHLPLNICGRRKSVGDENGPLSP